MAPDRNVGKRGEECSLTARGKGGPMKLIRLAFPQHPRPPRPPPGHLGGALLELEPKIVGGGGEHGNKSEGIPKEVH
jgi:hypothetical protein